MEQRQRRKNPIIALTGPMAAGKNFAAEILAAEGCAVIDADVAGHQAVENCRERILQTFGEAAAARGIALLDGDGKIDRRSLAQIVFASPQNLAAQEAIIHPEVVRIMEAFLKENEQKPRVLNATVLQKTELLGRCDFVIYIDAPRLLRLFRARKRDGASFAQLRKRFSAQKDLYAQYQVKNSDIYRVLNFAGRDALRKKLVAILGERT